MNDKEYYNNFMSSVPVAIPMIQRDYVQGADINFEKRDKFVRSMLESLSHDDCKEYELDFIYGSSDADNESGHFQPIDGQQRLTTLALLAWSLNNLTEGKYADHLPGLTYYTRPSTEQFLNHLKKYRITQPYTRVSEHLTTFPGWFARNWMQDPSIMAMLEMLDKLDQLLREEYADRLEYIAKRFFTDSPLAFERLDMKALNLGDDLYIKMNARGKMLTPFENLKAGFEGLLAKDFSNSFYDFGSIPWGENMPSIHEYFVYAIEHDWCDLLWPSAHKRWSILSDDEKQKVAYPRIDEEFMRLLDFVSHFLFFAQSDEKEPKQELFNLDRDGKRDALYRRNKQNVEMLLRVLDIFVKISKSRLGIVGFFQKIFTREYDPQQKRINLYEDVADTDLFNLCLTDRLTYVTEIMLWATVQYLINHPAAIECPDDNMRDYLRIIMGWLSTKRQRLMDGVKVGRNIRLSDFKEAAEIIEILSSTEDLFGTLLQTKHATLEQERRKAGYLAIGKYDIVRILSTCHELYYCFTLLYDSIDEFTTTEDYISKFEKFIGMKDDDRIRALVAHEYYGVPTMNNHYFYGLERHWDFFFTIPENDAGGKLCRMAFTDWMMNAPKSNKITDKTNFAYYIYKYPEFLNAVASWGTPLHYFIRSEESQYIVWAVKTMSTRPIMGYNVDPFGYAVSKLAKLTYNDFELYDSSYYSERGKLYLQRKNESGDVAMTVECTHEGWLISIGDGRFAPVKKFRKRFEVSDGNIVDNEGEFLFERMTLLDLPGCDRIETMVKFIASFA